MAVEEEMAARGGPRPPLMISVTITDQSGRTLSGQTVEAFWNSVKHASPLSVGVNCALGATEMRPYIAEFSKLSPTLVSAYPNAGFPATIFAFAPLILIGPSSFPIRTTQPPFSDPTCHPREPTASAARTVARPFA